MTESPTLRSRSQWLSPGWRMLLRRVLVLCLAATSLSALLPVFAQLPRGMAMYRYEGAHDVSGALRASLSAGVSLLLLLGLVVADRAARKALLGFLRRGGFIAWWVFIAVIFLLVSMAPFAFQWLLHH